MLQNLIVFVKTSPFRAWLPYKLSQNPFIRFLLESLSDSYDLSLDFSRYFSQALSQDLSFKLSLMLSTKLFLKLSINFSLNFSLKLSLKLYLLEPQVAYRRTLMTTFEWMDPQTTGILFPWAPVAAKKLGVRFES